MQAGNQAMPGSGDLNAHASPFAKNAPAHCLHGNRGRPPLRAHEARAGR